LETGNTEVRVKTREIGVSQGTPKTPKMHTFGYLIPV